MLKGHAQIHNTWIGSTALDTQSQIHRSTGSRSASAAPLGCRGREADGSAGVDAVRQGAGDRRGGRCSDGQAVMITRAIQGAIKARVILDGFDGRALELQRVPHRLTGGKSQVRWVATYRAFRPLVHD